MFELFYCNCYKCLLVVSNISHGCLNEGGVVNVLSKYKNANFLSDQDLF